MSTDSALRIMAIGAHPDDCEIKCGGTAALWARAGHHVCFVSMTNGQAGHHQQAPAELVQRRIAEARAAARVAGIESQVLPNADGHLEPSLSNRLALIRLIRTYQPDLIVTNRPNDYHPDHRYTSQLVQDAAFSLTVPNIAPEVPAMPQNPLIMYWWDAFQKPLAFQPDAVVSIDATWDTKVRMLHEHTSQVYEWLPWLEGKLDQIPDDNDERLHWLEHQFLASRNKPSIAERYRDHLVARYSQKQAENITHAEAFERCEYGAPFDQAAYDRFFPTDS